MAAVAALAAEAVVAAVAAAAAGLKGQIVASENLNFLGQRTNLNKKTLRSEMSLEGREVLFQRKIFSNRKWFFSTARKKFKHPLGFYSWVWAVRTHSQDVLGVEIMSPSNVVQKRWDPNQG